MGVGIHIVGIGGVLHSMCMGGGEGTPGMRSSCPRHVVMVSPSTECETICLARGVFGGV